MQFTAEFVTGHHGGAITVGHAPQHFVQKAPALIAPIVRGALQQLHQLQRNPCLKRPGFPGVLFFTAEQVGGIRRLPADLAGVDFMAQQPASLLSPGLEQVVAVEADHPHRPIC